MADSLADCARKFEKLGDLLTGKHQAEIMRRLGVEAKKDATKATAKDVGSDLAMSNWKRAKLTSKYEVEGNTRVTLTPTPSGPWKVITEGAGAHEVSAKHGKIVGRGAKRARKQRDLDVAFGAKGAWSGAKPLRTPYGPRYRVKIPKTRGKGTWDDVGRIVRAESPKRVDQEVVKALRQVF